MGKAACDVVTLRVKEPHAAIADEEAGVGLLDGPGRREAADGLA
jgi:hypothetical protein